MAVVGVDYEAKSLLSLGAGGREIYRSAGGERPLAAGWLRDGSLIYASAADPTLDLEPSEPTTLITVTPEGRIRARLRTSDPVTIVGLISPAPDGLRVFVSARGRDSGRFLGIYALDVRTGAVTRLVGTLGIHYGEPVVTNNGDLLVIAGEASGDRSWVERRSLDGRLIARLTDPAMSTPTTLTHDSRGNRVLVETVAADKSGNSLESLDPLTGALTTLLRQSVREPSVLADGSGVVASLLTFDRSDPPLRFVPLES